MQKKNLRNKSEIVNQMPNQFSTFLVRSDRKNKTAVNVTLQDIAQKNSCFVKKILLHLIDQACLISNESEQQIQYIFSCIEENVSFCIPIVEDNSDEMAVQPKIQGDIQPKPDPRYVVENKELNPLFSWVSKESIPLQARNENTKSQKQFINKMKKQHLSKIRGSVYEPIQLDLQQENIKEDIMDKSMRNFKKHTMHKQKQAPLLVPEVTKNGDEYVYGDEGELIKINKKQNSQIRPIKKKKEDMSISVLSSTITKAQPQEKALKIKCQTKSYHVDSDFMKMKKKYPNSQRLEDYLNFSVRTKRGVNIQSVHDRPNQSNTLKLPKISKNFID